MAGTAATLSVVFSKPLTLARVVVVVDELAPLPHPAASRVIAAAVAAIAGTRNFLLITVNRPKRSLDCLDRIGASHPVVRPNYEM
jgi:hypothetical protein